MTPEDEHANVSGELEGEKHRDWPRLTLKGSSAFDPMYDEITEEHELYPLAAWGYHHANDLAPGARRGFFDALARVWPSRGRKKTRYKRGVVMSMLLAAGVSPTEVAEKWHVSPGEVTDSVRDVKRAAGTPSEQRIVSEHESF